MNARDMREFTSFLRGMTPAQVQGVYDKESAADRQDYAQLAILEAERRGIDLDLGTPPDYYGDDEDEQHTRDTDCTVDPETGCCTLCGAGHGDPCPVCGGRAFHVSGCKEVQS